MKLATYKDGSRDGQLVVVSRDLSQAHYASGIANRLQQVLDDWNYLSPQLQDLYNALNSGHARHAFPFDPRQCMAPLPRAYQWVSSVAYGSHAELVYPAPDAAGSAGRGADPLMYQGASDALAGPCDAIGCASEELEPDFEAQLAVVSGDLPAGCPADRALEGIRLVMLANAVSLRALAPAEQARGFGLMGSKPLTAFSPVAVTPDELGEAWARGRLQLPLHSTWNGRKVGMCDAGVDMTHHFGKLLAHLCLTRPVRAGSIIGSGAVSNQGVTAKGRMDWPKGYHCIAEKRAMETQQDGQPSTGYLRWGDTVRIEMKGRDGHSIFGAIEQEVVAPVGRDD